MTVRVVLGSALCAAVLLAWGFLFWVVLSPPGGRMSALPDEGRITGQLLRDLPASGTYYFPLPTERPGRGDGAAFEAFRRRHLAGPIGRIQFRREGADPLGPGLILAGLLHAFVSSLLASLLLVIALPVLETYVSRVSFVFLAGLFAAVAVGLSDPIWWRLPWDEPLYDGLYQVLTWLVAGLVLASVIRTPRGYSMTDQSKPLWKRALDAD